MNLYLVLFLRLVHVIAGLLWAGAAVAYIFMFSPSVQALGAAGGQFMQHLVERRRYPVYMQVTSSLTILAGAILLWNSSGGFNMTWLTSGPGLGFTIGSVAAAIAYIAGTFMLGPRAARMGALGKAIAAAGGPPSPDQMAEMRKLEREMATYEKLDFVFLVISLVTMATARYWYF